MNERAKRLSNTDDYVQKKCEYPERERERECVCVSINNEKVFIMQVFIIFTNERK